MKETHRCKCGRQPVLLSERTNYSGRVFFVYKCECGARSKTETSSREAQESWNKLHP